MKKLCSCVPYSGVSVMEALLFNDIDVSMLGIEIHLLYLKVVLGQAVFKIEEMQRNLKSNLFFILCLKYCPNY